MCYSPATDLAKDHPESFIPLSQVREIKNVDRDTIDAILETLNRQEDYLTKQISLTEKLIKKIDKNIVHKDDNDDEFLISHDKTMRTPHNDSATKYNKSLRKNAQNKNNNHLNERRKASNRRLLTVQSPKKENKKCINTAKSKIESHAKMIMHIKEEYGIDFNFKEGEIFKTEKLFKGVIKKLYTNGDFSLVFPNGTTKIYHKDQIFTKFNNGDRLQEFRDGTKAYKYNSNSSIEITFPNKVNLIYFADGQIERTGRDGSITITFPNGVVKTIFKKKGSDVELTSE